MADTSLGVFARIARYRLETVNFFVGAVGLSFELVATRIVAPYIGTTIYTWTSVIGVVLAALAVGYIIGGRLADKRDKAGDVILLLLAAAASLLLINLAKDGFLSDVSRSSLALKWQTLLACTVLFSLPNILLGATSAYLARLNIANLAKSGEKLSNIYSAGTLGSLAGTFLTGYVLLGYIGTSRIVGILAVCLVAASFLLHPLRFLPLRLLVLFGALLMVGYPPSPRIIGLVADLNTNYSRVIVKNSSFDSLPVRVLETDNLGWQSGVFANGQPGLVFPYIRAMAYISGLNPNADSYLVVGGGAFTLPAYLAKAHPGTPVDVVEIDGQLPSISKQYFSFKPTNNLNIFKTDGRQFINQNSKHYDFILMDAFTSITPPFQLITLQAATKFSHSLSPNGVFAINVISATQGAGAGLINSVARTFMKVFPNVEIYNATTNVKLTAEQNLILVASKQPINQDKLRSLVNQPEDQQIFKAPVSIKPSEGVVITDDFAPIDRFEQTLYAQ